MTGPTIASCVIFNPNILRECIALKHQEIDVKIQINHNILNHSARPAEGTNSRKECIQIIIHVWLNIRCKTH